jgi:hypothetical protein
MHTIIPIDQANLGGGFVANLGPYGGASGGGDATSLNYLTAQGFTNAEAVNIYQSLHGGVPSNA